MVRLNWDYDELILACDVLAANDWHEPPRTSSVLADLSAILRALPIHPAHLRDEDFRGIGSVRRKLSNLATAHPDYGGKRTKGGAVDEVALRDYTEHPDRMHAIAEDMRRAWQAGELARLPPPEPVSADVTEAVEGATVERLCAMRGRNRKLRAARLAMAAGDFACEVCGFNFASTYGPRGETYVECHHVIPLSVSGPVKTNVNDLALLCANCHRMIHHGGPLLTPRELRALVDQCGKRRSFADTGVADGRRGTEDGINGGT